MERKQQFKFKHLFESIANWLLLPNFSFLSLLQVQITTRISYNFDAAILPGLEKIMIFFLIKKIGFFKFKSDFFI